MEVTHDMSDQELKALLIDKYTDLQRIKRANGDNCKRRIGLSDQSGNSQIIIFRS